MHVLQWIAIKNDTDDPSDAVQSVTSFLEQELNPGSSWFDWFITGGGRWNPEGDGYNDGATNMVISLAEHGLTAIQEKIDWAIEARMREFADYTKDIDFSGIQDKLNSYNGTMDYSFDLYPLNKAIEMLQGNWDFNSYFYDAENYSTNPKWLLDKIASGDVDWYLVPVDFHF